MSTASFSTEVSVVFSNAPDNGSSNSDLAFWISVGDLGVRATALTWSWSGDTIVTESMCPRHKLIGSATPSDDGLATRTTIEPSVALQVARVRATIIFSNAMRLFSVEIFSPETIFGSTTTEQSCGGRQSVKATTSASCSGLISTRSRNMTGVASASRWTAATKVWVSPGAEGQWSALGVLLR